VLSSNQIDARALMLEQNCAESFDIFGVAEITPR